MGIAGGTRSMPDLFREPTTLRVGPLSPGEPAVRWYIQSTRPEAAASRSIVNRWYADFPDSRGQLARRILSERNAEHYQAIDELYVHHLLREDYEDVRYEEEADAPDFRAYDQGQRVLAVEVASLFDRADWRSEEARHDRLAQALNRRVKPTAGYWVDFEIEPGGPEPAPSRFAKFVIDQIALLPPHETVHSVLDASTLYEEVGVRISVRFLAMRADAASKTDPGAQIVGMGAMIGGFVNSGQRLKDRVEDKAGGRYNIAGTPYLIAVGVHDFLCSHEQAATGLYGNEAIVVSTLQPIWRSNGVFGADRERPQGRQRRLSGVLLVSNLHTWEAPAASLNLYENPYADSPVPEGLFRSARRFGPVKIAEGECGLAWRPP
jgi:hypothetical protein